MELVRDKSILVIEDAAQAVGAKLNGKAVGSLGHAACFSLHPLKNMRVFGDGGMLTSSDEEIIQLIKHLYGENYRTHQRLQRKARTMERVLFESAVSSPIGSSSAPFRLPSD